MELVIYTDGSVWRGWMGFAAIALFDGRQREFAGRARGGSPQLAELLAIRLVLRQIARKKRARCAVTIYSDAQSVVEALNGRQKIRPIQNIISQVQQLLAEFASWSITWIKAHAGHEHNERAHMLAGIARKGLLECHTP